MIGFAYGVARASDLGGAGWLHGLKLAAVAVVAQAVWGMGKKLCTDRALISLCIGTAAMLLAVPGATAQLGVIVFGSLVGWRLHRDTIAVGAVRGKTTGARGHLDAAATLVAFFALLVALPALAFATGSHHLAVFDSFNRSGSRVRSAGPRRRSPGQTLRWSACSSRRSTTRSSPRACEDRAMSSPLSWLSGYSSSGSCRRGWSSAPARRRASGCCSGRESPVP
jgi:hypothetical protein